MAKRGPSPSLYLSSAAALSSRWPLAARIQPFSEHTTVIGSPSTQHPPPRPPPPGARVLALWRRVGGRGAAGAELGLAADLALGLLALGGDRLPLAIRVLEQRLEL